MPSPLTPTMVKGKKLHQRRKGRKALYIYKYMEVVSIESLSRDELSSDIFKISHETPMSTSECSKNRGQDNIKNLSSIGHCNLYHQQGGHQKYTRVETITPQYGQFKGQKTKWGNRASIPGKSVTCSNRPRIN